MGVNAVGPKRLNVGNPDDNDVPNPNPALPSRGSPVTLAPPPNAPNPGTLGMGRDDSCKPGSAEEWVAWDDVGFCVAALSLVCVAAAPPIAVDVAAANC